MSLTAQGAPARLVEEPLRGPPAQVEAGPRTHGTHQHRRHRADAGARPPADAATKYGTTQPSSFLMAPQ